MTENPTFEKAFMRLEEILHILNEGKASLDESLTLFEEANGLIQLCNNRLTKAEQKIELLIKNREGDLQVTEGKPETTPFITESNNTLTNKEELPF